MGNKEKSWIRSFPLKKYKKILKELGGYGYSISSNIPNPLLEVKIKNKTPIWSICVILGFICYLFPLFDSLIMETGRLLQDHF